MFSPILQVFYRTRSRPPCMLLMRFAHDRPPCISSGRVQGSGSCTAWRCQDYSDRSTASPDAQDAESPPRSAFGTALRDYLAALRLPAADAARAFALVDGHDFSSARAALLPSVPGRHQGACRKPHSDGVCRAPALRARPPPGFVPSTTSNGVCRDLALRARPLPGCMPACTTALPVPVTVSCQCCQHGQCDYRETHDVGKFTRTAMNKDMHVCMLLLRKALQPPQCKQMRLLMRPDI